MTEFDEFDENNPMNDPMVQKPYVQDFVNNITEGVEVTEEPLPEAKYIKPPLGESGNGATIPPTATAETPPPPGAEMPEHFAQMSEGEQRRNAEKSATVYLRNYQQLMPIPFVMISSFNMRKMKKLHDKGEIDLNMPIREDGTTTHSYMDSYNKKVIKVFEISDEMAEELREPLVDVLMESGFVPSPMVRLCMAAAPHLAKFGQEAVKLYMEKSDDMDTFKQFRSDQIKAMRERGGGFGGSANSQPTNHSNTPPAAPEEKIQTETQPATESVIHSQEEEMIIPPISSIQEEINLNEYLNSDNDDSVEIEEVVAEEA